MTSKIYAINGLNIHTLNAGKNEGTALIFLHGNSGNAHAWDAQLNDGQLQAHYRLIAIDLPGHGLSSRSANYSMPHMAEILGLTIAALDVTEYILCGLSYGTAMVGELAGKIPGCKGFCLCGCNLTSNAHNPATYIIFSPEMAPLVAENPDDDAILTFARHLTANNAHGTAEAYMNSYKATDPAFRTAVGNAISTQEWSDEFANIEGTGLPVMVVFGKQERAINTSYMDGIANKWKGMIYHIDGAGHFVNAEQPEQFNALLVEFAAELL